MNTAHDTIAVANAPTPAVDVAGLVAAALLDLDQLTAGAVWQNDELITYFTTDGFGPDGSELGEVDVVLQCATVYGITVYRWAEYDVQVHECGPATLDRDQAVEDGSDHASENDQESY